MGRKYLKILISTLSLTSLGSLSACATQQEKKPEEISKLETIEIVSDFNDLRLEVNQEYTSKPIEIKCYDNNKKEIQSKTQLFLFSLTNNEMDIFIKDNRIVIGAKKDVGQHKYKIVALSEDNSIVSNIKDLNIDVYRNVQYPDSIEINGNNEFNLFFPTSQSFDFEIVGKLNGEIFNDFDPKSNIEISIKSSSSKQTKDLFGNDIFNAKQIGKKINLNISKNIDASYTGKYELELKATLLSKPSIYAIKRLNFELVYGLNYVDKNTLYSYSRKDIDSEWNLMSIPSSRTFIEKEKVLNEIYGSKVTGIDDNFCSSSGIKTFISTDLPDFIKHIGDHSFYMQEANASLYIQNVETISEYAFYGCATANINPTWDLKLTSIGKEAFNKCPNLNIRYLNNIVYLGESCLRGVCSNEIHLGPNLSIIGAQALTDCSNLSNIYIKAKKPPQLMGDFIGGSCPVGLKIHVPSDALNSYRNDPNWSIYQEKLVGDM